MSHLEEVHHVENGIRRVAFPYGNELDGSQYDDHQVND